MAKIAARSYRVSVRIVPSPGFALIHTSGSEPAIAVVAGQLFFAFFATDGADVELADMGEPGFIFQDALEDRLSPSSQVGLNATMSSVGYAQLLKTLCCAGDPRRFHDSPVFNQDDAIRDSDGLGAMCDHHPGHFERRKASRNELLGFQIQMAGGLIENQDRGPAVKRSSD